MSPSLPELLKPARVSFVERVMAEVTSPAGDPSLAKAVIVRCLVLLKVCSSFPSPLPLLLVAYPPSPPAVDLYGCPF